MKDDIILISLLFDIKCSGQKHFIFLMCGSEAHADFCLHILSEVIQCNRTYDDYIQFLSSEICWGWSGGSAVRSAYCSHRRPRFAYQHTHGSSQASVTLAPGDLTPSSGLCMHMVALKCRQMLSA